MTNVKLLKNIIAIDEEITNKIIKPKQLSVLKKQLYGQKLTENEKRYLRGNLRNKLEFFEQLRKTQNEDSEDQQLLNIISTYYITGLEALRYHGFGWYFKPKIIEIINTRIEGKVRLNTATLKFYRVRSINYSDFIVDELTGLKYAINEQIIKDIKYTRNQYTELVWKNMLNRYGKQFVKDPDKYPSYKGNEEVINLSKFGV
jgi:hypothetical protein